MGRDFPLESFNVLTTLFGFFRFKNLGLSYALWDVTLLMGEFLSNSVLLFWLVSSMLCYLLLVCTNWRLFFLVSYFDSKTLSAFF